VGVRIIALFIYGYEYASTSLIEDLFKSYATWDGRNGTHGNPAVVSGIDQLLNDFGYTVYDPGDGVDKIITTDDGYVINYDSFNMLSGFYGLRNECGPSRSCRASALVSYDVAGNPTMANQERSFGWSSAYSADISTYGYYSGLSYNGSFLVRAVTSPVPIPAAAWLFGSGLVGLAGIARRKKA